MRNEPPRAPSSLPLKVFIVLEMTLPKFMKQKDVLHDLKGSLSASLPSKAIALANREVQKAMRSAEEKRGQYAKYICIVNNYRCTP